MTKIGKDREGAYHPPKGSPSGKSKKKATVENETILDNLENQGEEIPDHVQVRHPNRHAGKRESRSGKKNTITTAKNNTRGSSASTAADLNTDASEIPVLKIDFLKELNEQVFPVCISIYLPTHASGAEVNEKQDFIAFKNILQRVTAELKATDWDEKSIQKLLAPAFDLIKDDSFWNNLSPGLAVFIGDGYFRFYKMPLTPTEQLVINTRFIVQPLTRVLASPEYFYILVISKKQSIFYRADAFGIVHIDVPELPNGIEDVVHFEEKDDQKLFRTGSSGAGGGANYHGIGAGKPDEKQNISMYLDEVDETLWKDILHNENKPLLLAGVEYLLPLYREVAQYNFIWPEVLTGNMENTSLSALHDMALNIMKPYFDEARGKALERYQNKSATELTSSIVADIIPAAYYGKVDTLFVSKEASLWGTFNAQDNVLTLRENRDEGDESLIDAVITQTFLNGGRVYELDTAQMPAQSPLAALMRY